MPGSKKTVIPNGTKFNQLTVLHLIGSNRHKQRIYACLCNCGKETRVNANRIKSGLTKSCGCAKKCSREHVYGAGFAAALATYRASSAAKKFEWHLASEQFHKLTQQNCVYCGTPPTQISKKSGSNGRIYVYNGIDRIDSAEGYTEENTVTCCKQCNFAKRLLTVKEFLTLVTLIYRRRVSKEIEIPNGHIPCFEYDGSRAYILRKKPTKLNVKSKAGQRLIDLTGLKIGHLTVLKRGKNLYKIVRWLCRCDCGRIKEAISQNLREGRTKSCGCCADRKGHPGYTRLKSGESTFNKFYKTLKYWAARRNLTFELSREKVYTLCKSPCFYCSRSKIQTLQTKTGYGVFTYNGIDRVDNGAGYTNDNIVTCCADCNRMKNVLTENQFYSWIKKVYEYRHHTC